MSVLFDWRIRDIENTANEAKRRFYEIDALRSEVARLACAIGEIRSAVDGLRSELQAASDKITELESLRNSSVE